MLKKSIIKEGDSLIEGAIYLKTLDYPVEEWKKLYEQGLSLAKIADQFQTVKSTVSNVLTKHGVEKRKPTSEALKHIDKKEFQDLYISGRSLRQIAEKFNCSENAVKSHLLIMGTMSRERGDSNRKYPLNEQYFDVLDTDEKCYWLGFIAADGSVMNYTMGKRTLYQMTLTQHVKDIDHLEDFKKAIGSNQNLRLSKGTSVMRLTLNSKRLFDSLGNNGILPRKVAEFEFPDTVSEKFYHSFIRGYFDGDGCASTSRRENGKISYLLGFTGAKSLLTRISEIIYDRVGSTKPKVVPSSNPYGMRKSDTHSLSYCSLKNTIMIRDWLYNDSSVYLKRKKEILDTFVL